MNILQLYDDYSIKYQTEGHKHCRPGWANVSCPFCTGNPGLHLGVELTSTIFYCWRCGWKPASKVIAKLLNVSEQKAKEIIREYKGIVQKQEKAKIRIKPHRHPTDTGELQKQHIKYLEKRNFDSNKLKKIWGLLGTGPIAKLDKINYGHRILAPIIHGGKEVSFQARDITGKSKVKYLACPEIREVIKHKHTIYCREDKIKDTGICVEGITDVWRFGIRAFAVFGIEYTHYQIRLIAKRFKRVFVAFDDDPQAIVQAKELVADLKFRGVDSIYIPIVGDPGEMDQDEANYLVKQLIGE